jgi:AraC family transcriptional regulator, arabinose operon regulatory protein
MKSFKLSIAGREPSAAFQIHRLGLHEKMGACIVDRPEGTHDYLFMLFHSEVRVKAGEEEQVWPPLSLMVWTPADGHYYGNALRPWEHSWLHCSGSEVGSILKVNGIPIRKRIVLTDSSLMEHFLLEAAAELNVWSQPDTRILRNLFENFVRSLVRQVSQHTEQRAPTRLLAIRSHVEQHFAEPLCLKDLAKWAGWSEPHLCTEFRRVFGIPVFQFVLQLRVSQASYLLRDQNRRVGEIAAAVGYSDIYTFSKMFKRHTGASPKKFRELHLQGASVAERRQGVRPMGASPG